MSPLIAAFLVALNLGLIFLLIAAPLGRRTLRRRATIAAPAARVWGALWPLGPDAGWSGERIEATPIGAAADLVRIMLSREGRDGAPMTRIMKLAEVAPGRGFTARIVDDSALDPAFWAHYCETVELCGEDGAVEVTLSQTDRYRGLAFLGFRYFALRRELVKLKRWAETGRFRRGGAFEHPLTQLGFAVASAFVLWPFFGLTFTGLIFAAVLTFVVALHELGHIAAFRIAGHRGTRMIFIPLLGGVAIGGRPYDSRFEVAFVALMGAGLSAFVVAFAAVAAVAAGHMGDPRVANLFAVMAGCAALFNLANLAPMWKFDGGQVLRQICPGGFVLALSSCGLFLAFVAAAYAAGFSQRVLFAAGAVFVILSLITSGTAVRPRRELKPISAGERLALAGALVAAYAVHGLGLVWAAHQLFA